MTIRGIEKYGKFTKSKKAVTSRVKAFVTGSKTPEEEKAEQDALKREKIVSLEAHDRHDRHDGDGDGDDPRDHESRQREEKTLPGEGKKVEDMTEDERMDRGIALLVKAFERGLTTTKPNDGGHDAKNGTNEDGAKSKA